MHPIYEMRYYEYKAVQGEPVPRRRFIRLDDITSITEPLSGHDNSFEIVCKMNEHPIIIRSGFGHYYEKKLKDTFDALLEAWSLWVEGATHAPVPAETQSKS